jgi:type IX secretion system PorP/SprF family membrane protein
MKKANGHWRMVNRVASQATVHSPVTIRHSFWWLCVPILSVILSTSSLIAQDIHFSQFFNAPLALGPGTIGQFDGDYRANGIFRQQWRSVSVPYRTLGLGGDARDFLGVQGLGVGVWLFNDRAGDSRLNQFHLSLGASWTQRFGDEHAHSITGGVQAGFTSLTLDSRALSFDNQYNGFTYDPSLPNGERFDRDGLLHPDVNAGLVYRYTPSKRELIQAGVGVFNLTTPAIGFLGEPGVPLDRRSTFHVITQFPIHERFDLLPMVQYMTQGKFRELDLGTNLRYILLDRYGLNRAVQFGIHWRADDAGYLYAGLEYDDWTFGVSYDINTSDLVPASRNRGGIEFAVVRIFKQRPAVPVRFKACPDQI